MSKNQSLMLGLVAVAGIVLAVGLWLNRGYGEVSPQTYQYSQALYSACLNKNKEHLSKIEVLLSASEDVPEAEREWLEAIVAQAQSDDWVSASKDARRMMEDQIKY